MTRSTLLRKPIGMAALLLWLAWSPALQPLFGGGWSAQAQSVAAAADLPLWQVRAGGNVVYLLGSVHMLRPDVYPLDAAMYEAFDSAAVVAFELDYEEMLGSAALMMMRGLFTDGRTLRDVLPEEAYQELAARLGAMAVPMQLLMPMKPWTAALTLTSLMMQQGGYSAEHGLDLHFYQRAREAGKEVVAFETTSEQIDVFDGLSMDGQVAYLRSTLREMDDGLRQMDELTELWIAGDAEAIAALLMESTAEHPELFDRLLMRRNRNWLPRVEELLHGGRPALVIVGMAHLAGEESVISMLLEEGYDVARVAPVGAR